MRKQLLVLSALVVGLASQTALAGLITPMSTDPSVGAFTKITPTDDMLSEHTLADGSKIGFSFIDRYAGNTPAPLERLTTEQADYSNWGDGPLWDDNHDLFTTGREFSRGNTIWIDLTDTTAYGFSFQIGANKNASGWFDVHYNNMNNSIAQTGIRIGPGYSPSSPGFQVTNVGGSCQQIDKIRIDPNDFVWGVFNMGIDTTGDSCVSVPEPGSVGLLSLGLIGLGMVRLNQRRRREARQPTIA